MTSVENALIILHCVLVFLQVTKNLIEQPRMTRCKLFCLLPYNKPGSLIYGIYKHFILIL